MSGCASAAGGEQRSLPAGLWGGEHILLEVTAERASVELDCAHGAVEGPLRVDAQGRFDVRGTYVQERGGPVREGQEDSRPARYGGRVEGRTMTLIITLTDPDQELGPFELTHGRAPRLTKCL